MFFFLSNVRVECSVVSRLFGAACQLWLESWRLEKRSRPPPTSESLQCRACVGRKFAKAGTRLPRTSKENRFRRRRRHSSNGSGSSVSVKPLLCKTFDRSGTKPEYKEKNGNTINNTKRSKRLRSDDRWSWKSLFCVYRTYQKVGYGL